MMALRVEQLRPLKVHLLNLMLKKTMTAGNIMANLMIETASTTDEKNDVLTRLGKYQLPRQISELLE